MKVRILLLTLLCIIFGAQAETKASRESVEKLMLLTDVSKIMDAMQGQVSAMFNNMATQMNISEPERPAFEKYMGKIDQLLKEKMTWEQFKEPMINVYLTHFNQHEIDGLIEFYKSDVGKSMTQKMPLVMQDSMMAGQQAMRSLMPEIQAIAQDMQSEIQQARQQDGE
ncbi:hypothetical protein Patl_2850 [Paraglaciecola sp. T6c]|uniref:DUF2059 domain-containing protein n=1 Tax=Pseudoalteromonas atlantica (strain T6c / ATCC BAA-1087) TaxID=3042615 RepID=UPI00005C53FA|nr:DUF2059 domain-containing protein [Paraglaciecola sp. T6c]ABG41360.1 hypothetical protein Patl_2850 [Paraglaciecola sp. T6c]